MSHKLFTIILVVAGLATGNIPQPEYELIIAKSRLKLLIQLLERAPENKKKAIKNEIAHNRTIIQSYNKK